MKTLAWALIVIAILYAPEVHRLVGKEPTEEMMRGGVICMLVALLMLFGCTFFAE